MIEVTDLYIHPLKSAASISVDSAAIDNFGFKNDRRWMLVDSSGNFLSQRQLPIMCLIKAVVDGAVLMLTVPNQSPLKVTVDKSREQQVIIWGDSCRSYDCGDEAAGYLSVFLETKCRMVYFPDEGVRQVDMDYARKGELTGFSDGFPLLIVSQESLDFINNKLKKNVSMARFRPNIVVSGVEAFAEDGWKEVVIGGITLRIVKPCSRCAIPSIDPLTGFRSAELIKVLRTYRMRNDKIYFGQNVIADSTGELEVGMTVDVVK